MRHDYLHNSILYVGRFRNSPVGANLLARQSMSRQQVGSYIYGYPLFCNTKYDAWLACGHLFGVWAYARASMKFAPDGPH